MCGGFLMFRDFQCWPTLLPVGYAASCPYISSLFVSAGSSCNRKVDTCRTERAYASLQLTFFQPLLAKHPSVEYPLIVRAQMGLICIPFSP